MVWQSERQKDVIVLSSYIMILYMKTHKIKISLKIIIYNF